jgi:hypothetical protein
VLGGSSERTLQQRLNLIPIPEVPRSCYEASSV